MAVVVDDDEAILRMQEVEVYIDLEDDDRRSPSSSSNAGGGEEAEEAVVGKCRRRVFTVLGWVKGGAKFLSQHVGLLGMVVAYAIAGALIFQQLEAPNEKSGCIQRQNQYFPAQLEMANRLWLVAVSYRDDLDEYNAIDAFQTLLSEYRDQVLGIGYTGMNCSMMGMTGGPSYTWSFPGALFFACTVFTTVGN